MYMSMLGLSVLTQLGAMHIFARGYADIILLVVDLKLGTCQRIDYLNDTSYKG
jgi:hypothetical protein